MDEALRVRALSVQLSGRDVLRSVSMSAPFAKITGVLGPNGAGKSTLLRAICGLVSHEGQISIADRAFGTLTTSERARLLSFVPQRSQLTAALEVRDLVMQGRYAHRRSFARPSAEDRRAVDEALHETNAEAFIGRLFSELSAGEQRRVLLARALATGARILLLDEPSAALDIEHALRLYELLRRLAKQGRCIVLVIHDLEHARSHTDRVVLLQAGKVVDEATTSAVLTVSRIRDVYGVDTLQSGGLTFRLPGTAP
jgi:iron complex transport system ATP-binding protein